MEQLWRVFGPRAMLLMAVIPVAAALVWGLAAWRTRRLGRRAAWSRSLLEVGLVLAVLPVLYLVFVPVPGLSGRIMVSWVPGVQLAPIFGAEGATPASSALAQAVGNLLLLVPVAVLAPLRFPRLRSVIRVTIAAALLSVMVECVQVLGHLGRVGAVDDVLLNTAGAALAALVTRRWWAAPKVERESGGTRSRASQRA